LGKWIKFTGRCNWKPNAKSSKICSRHFEDCCFREAEQRRNLLAGSFPTILNNNELTTDDGGGAKETVNHQSDQQSTHSSSCCRLCGLTTSESYLDLNYHVLEFCFPTILFDEKLPKKICAPCNHKLKEFSEFIRKVVEVQKLLTESIAVQTQPKDILAAPFHLTEIEKLPETPKIVKIKQEPLMTIKEEKIDNQWKNTNIISNSLFPYSEASSWHPTLFTNFVTATSTTTSLISSTTANQMETTSTSYRKNDSKTCEILEIVNLSRPLIDITDPNITRILHSQDFNFAPLSNMNIISLKPLKVEHPEEEEYDENLEHLMQTLEEHSYARRYEKERPEDFKTENNDNDEADAEVEFVESCGNTIVEIDEINTSVRNPRKVSRKQPLEKRLRPLRRVYKRCEQCKQIFLSGRSLKNHKKKLCGNLLIFREMRRIVQETKQLAKPLKSMTDSVCKSEMPELQSPETSIEVPNPKNVTIKAEPNGNATKIVIKGNDPIVDRAERQQFMCSVCGKNLSSKYSLKNHEAIHKGKFSLINNEQCLWNFIKIG
jgi:hypothetical protein